MEEVAPALGHTITEQRLTVDGLLSSDEVFLTGTAAELIPVVDVDSRQIGNGEPGEQTHRLLQAFHKVASSDGRMIR